jgi:hypothetical protein
MSKPTHLPAHKLEQIGARICYNILKWNQPPLGETIIEMDDPMVTLITVLPATSTVGNGDFKQ